jgi:hypothetical protein
VILSSGAAEEWGNGKVRTLKNRYEAALSGSCKIEMRRTWYPKRFGG